MTLAAVLAEERKQALALLVVGVAALAMNYVLAGSESAFYLGSAVFGPLCTVLGLGTLVAGGPGAERVRRGETLTTLRGRGLMTPRQWALVALGVALGLLNLWMLLNGRGPYA